MVCVTDGSTMAYGLPLAHRTNSKVVDGLILDSMLIEEATVATRFCVAFDANRAITC
jgi:hypothetical protein